MKCFGNSRNRLMATGQGRVFVLIDFHTHPVLIKQVVEESEDLKRAVRDVFNLQNALQPIETFKDQMKTAGVVKAVLLPIDCSTAHGCKIFSNEQIADLVSRYDFFIGFASVDPLREEAPNELRKAITDLGLKGLKLDRVCSGFTQTTGRKRIQCLTKLRS